MAYEFKALMFFTGHEGGKLGMIRAGERSVTITIEDDRVSIVERPGYELRMSAAEYDNLSKARMTIGKIDKESGMLRYTRNPTKGKLMLPEYEKKTGPELIAAYNALAETDAGKAAGAKPVTRFSDRETALKRVLSLHKKVHGDDAGAVVAVTKKTDDKPDRASPATAVHPTEEALLPEEGDVDMAQVQAIVEKFAPRPGSNREKALKTLAGKFGKPVPRTTLLKATYGSANEKNIGALSMVLKGAESTIKGKKLPLQIVRERDEKEGMTYALKRK